MIFLLNSTYKNQINKYKMKLNQRKGNIYAYNISSNSTSKNKRFNKLSFKTLTGNIYDDLINSDLSIRRNKRKLSLIKNNTIKESIYSNRNIPKSWKNLMGYTNEVYKAIDKDPNFAYYLGSSNRENGNNGFLGTKLKNIDSNTNSEKNKKFISIENIDKYIKDNFDNNKQELNENNDKNNDYKKYNKTISYNDKNHDMKIVHHHQWEANNNILNDKFMSSKLDEYRSKYDIDKFARNVRHKIKEIHIDVDDLYIPKTEKDTKKNFYREFLKEITQNNREMVLRKTIYSNLIPENNTNRRFYKTYNNKGFRPLKFKRMKKYSPLKTTPMFLNKEKNSNIGELNNKIKRDLELINYFGPHNSNCLVCKKRNMDFYTNSEPEQTLKLLNYLKKIKLNGKINKYDKKDKEN